MREAQADVSVIAGRIREEKKRDPSFTISAVPLLDQVVGNVRRSLLVLLGSVALVLLIACVNVANLLLARAGVRQREVAIRAALGAGWQRMVRQLLTESVLLGALGGAVGLAIAAASLVALRVINPGNIPRLAEITIDARVLVFAAAISILTGIIFGLAPAVRAVRVDLNSSLKSGGRSSSGGAGLNLNYDKLRGLMVVAELALYLMLLVERRPADSQLCPPSRRLARLQSRPRDFHALCRGRPQAQRGRSARAIRRRSFRARPQSARSDGGRRRHRAAFHEFRLAGAASRSKAISRHPINRKSRSISVSPPTIISAPCRFLFSTAAFFLPPIP